VLFISSDEKSLSDGSCASESLEAQIKKVVAENLMPSMIPYKVVKIEVLPKTESGKIKRNELRRIAHGLIQE